jgi:hypothetical protein
MSNYFIITVLFALVATLGLAGKADVQEAEAHGSEYCEMVELYESSNGELGWPAYDPNIHCN